jgi:predicted N-formylglutamate amidohydrolase
MAVMDGNTATDRNDLLSAHEPAAVAVIRSRAPALPVVLVCDHASARVPARLAGLGLGPEALASHIAWDIGAADVATRLGAALGLPVVLAGYSRLVVDCNRHLDDPTAMPAESDGIKVPGNVGLGAGARAARIDALYRPYHAAIEAELAALEGPGILPALVAVHSFTPVMGGKARPWHAGVLWDRDPRLALPLLDALRRDPGLVIGDNEPYSGRHPAGFTIDHHAEPRGRAHLSVELRQDLVDSPAGAAQWAERLSVALAPILAQAALYDPVAAEAWRTPVAPR